MCLTIEPWAVYLSGLVAGACILGRFERCEDSHARHESPRAPRLAPSIVFGLASLITLGCVGEHRILDDGCILTDEAPIAELLGATPHGVVLVGRPEALSVAWSEPSGLFAARLDGAGEPRRLGPACDAGLASEGSLLACARRGDDDKAQPGQVELIDVDEGRPLAVLDGVGPDSSGLDVAQTPEGWALAWNDARGTDAIVRLAREGREPIRLSRAHVRAGRPTLALEATPTPHLVVAWPESWVGRTGLEGSLRLLEGERTADLEPLTFDAASPTLALDAEGRAVLAFRDRRPPRSRAKLYLRRLDRRERSHEGVPANAEGAVSVAPCGGALVVVAPRTHSRSERLVAVRRHDPITLEGAGPEHQIYRFGAAFEYADVRCVGEDALIVVASRPTVEKPTGVVSRVRFTCVTGERR